MRSFRGIGWACTVAFAALGTGPLWANGDVAGQPCCGPAVTSYYRLPACPVPRCCAAPVTCCEPACPPRGPICRLVHRILHPFECRCKPCSPCAPAPIIVPPPPPVPLPQPALPPAAGEPGAGFSPAPSPPVTGSSYRPERPLAPVPPDVLTPPAPPPAVRLDHFASWTR
jgi:hypothetical protein